MGKRLLKHHFCDNHGHQQDGGTYFLRNLTTRLNDHASILIFRPHLRWFRDAHWMTSSIVLPWYRQIKGLGVIEEESRAVGVVLLSNHKYNIITMKIIPIMDHVIPIGECMHHPPLGGPLWPTFWSGTLTIVQWSGHGPILHSSNHHSQSVWISKIN